MQNLFFFKSYAVSFLLHGVYFICIVPYTLQEGSNWMLLSFIIAFKAHAL